MLAAKICIFSILLGCIPAIQPAKILGVFTSPGKSHLIIHMALMEALAERGHEVTVVTAMPWKASNKIRHIEAPLPNMFSPEQKAKIMKDKIENSKSFLLEKIDFLPKILGMANVTMHTDQFQKLLKEESFDLVVLGYFFNDFQIGLAAHFNCPLVLNFMLQPFSSLSDMAGTPRELSYVPNLFTQLTQPMSFFGRVYNFIYNDVFEALFNMYADNLQEKFYRSNFPSPKFRSFQDMKKNVSLVLINHHFSQGPIRPLPPAMVEVGGIQIDDKVKPLPADIKKFLDESGDKGAIYLSFGTHMMSASLTPKISKAMFNVFSKLPYRVLWKWDKSAEIPGKSPNIMYQEWTPQRDVLAHPKVKLFIGHGGQGGVVESQYNGVPLLVIPFFGDQNSNRESVENLGFGRGIKYLDITEELFRNEILEVLENPIYRNKVQSFAKLYKDRPMKAKDTATYWIEYVLRHHGAKHMQSPLVHMSYLQANNLDVLAFITLVLYIVYKIVKIIITYVIRKFKGKVKTQ